MKFTIGTVSNSLDLAEDLKLIKSSILYADEIELIGMTEYALYKYLPNCIFDAQDIDAMIPALRSFLQSLKPAGSEELLGQLDYADAQLQILTPYLKRKKHRSKQEIIAQMKFKQLEIQCREQLKSGIQQLYIHPGTQEIKNYVDRNIVSVYDYDFDGFDANELAGGYFANLMNAMYNGTAYPLFDKASSGLIDSVIKTKLLDIGRLDENVLRHAGIASEILMTLPTLESASVDELLSLKNENQVPLTNFRKAIYDFSMQIHSLPWDDNFQYDCLQLYNTQVLPKVQEINETLTQTSVLRNLGKRALADEELRKKAGYAAAGLTTAITTSTDLFGVFNSIKAFILVAGIAAVSKEAVTGFLKIADLYNKARTEATEKTDTARKNVMYYYYLASKI